VFFNLWPEGYEAIKLGSSKDKRIGSWKVGKLESF
jgi:hypothetical protein